MRTQYKRKLQSRGIFKSLDFCLYHVKEWLHMEINAAAMRI